MISENSHRSRRITALVQANVWEMVRQPTFLFSLAFFAFWIGVSKNITLFAFGQEMVMIREMGLSSMIVCGLWLAFISGIHLVSGEMDNKTTYTLLSKPIGRGEFLFAKYLSIFSTTLIAVAVLSLVLSLVVWQIEGPPDLSLFQGIFLIVVELAFFSALSLAFSLFCPPLLNFIFFFLFFTLGHLQEHLLGKIESLLGIKGIYFCGIYVREVVGMFLPNLEFLNLSSELAIKNIYPLSYLLVAFLYGILYTLLTLIVTFLGFERKEL